MRSRSSRTKRPGFAFILLCLLLFILSIAGGASRGDVLGQPIVRGAAAITLFLLILLGERPVVGSAKPVLYLVVAAIGVALLHLVPLPPAIWLKLPGREVFGDLGGVLGPDAPWRPLAVAPGPAINAAASLLVPSTVLWAVLSLTQDEQRQLPAVLLCLVLISTLAAVLQFSGAGFANPLINDTPGQPSGLFANRNHLALLLAQGCLLLPVWAFSAGRRARWRGPASIGLALLFSLTILATGSRAGILLGFFAIVGFGVLARRSIKAELSGFPRWVAPAVAAGSCAVVAIFVLLSVAAGRAESIERAYTVDASSDIRNRALPTVLELIGAFFPFGSGMGSFDAVFRLQEPFDLLKPTYFNHAHNDYLEILLDAGLPGLVLLLAALGWWAWASLRTFRTEPGGRSMLPKAGSGLLLLTFVASLFDYPARTPMIMAMVVIAAVWLSGHHGRDQSALPH